MPECLLNQLFFQKYLQMYEELKQLKDVHNKSSGFFTLYYLFILYNLSNSSSINLAVFIKEIKNPSFFNLPPFFNGPIVRQYNILWFQFQYLVFIFQWISINIMMYIPILLIFLLGYILNLLV